MAELDFYLSDEQRELQRALGEFVAKEITPIAARCDAEEHYPVEILRKLGALGYLGIRFPEKFGGAGGSNLDYAILCEELAYGSGGIALGVYVHMALACAALEAFASEALKRDWLPPALRGERIGAWAFAEAGAGSDAASIATRAVADGEDYRLNGSKLFITNGPIADFLVVVASTAPDQGLKGLSLFLVERERPGFRVGGALSKLGVRASEMAELVFEDCRIPRENLLGRENRGFLDALRTLTLGRIASAAFAAGVARLVPGGPLRHRGPGRAARGGAAAVPPGCNRGGPRAPARPRSLDGEALRHGGLHADRRAGAALPRRRRIHVRVAGAALLPRLQGLRVRRGLQRAAARDDRPRARALSRRLAPRSAGAPPDRVAPSGSRGDSRSSRGPAV
jgi:hypothetical protein